MPGESQQLPTSEPDPSVRAIETVQREIASLKDLLTERINHATDVANEKFLSIEKQLSQVEESRVEQKADTKTAVDAALTSQKEAVKEQTTASALAIDKSEKSTKEQLDQLRTTLTNGLDDLKDREREGRRH